MMGNGRGESRRGACLSQFLLKPHAATAEG